MAASDLSVNVIDEKLEYKITENEKNNYKNNDKSHFKSAEDELNYARNQKKKCSKCDENFPLSYFSGNTSGRDAFDKNGYRLRRPECTTCNKKAGKGKNEAIKFAKEEGIPYKAPSGTKCEICGTTENIVFDHDHNLNKFRGWLCNPCNRSMGCLGDNIDGLVNTINYLLKTNKKKIVQDPETYMLTIVE
jgi:hypothetical protein